MQNDIHDTVFPTAGKRSNYERTYQMSSLFNNSSFNWIETRAKKTARQYSYSRLNHPLLGKKYETYMNQKSPTTYLNTPFFNPGSKPEKYLKKEILTQGYLISSELWVFWSNIIFFNQVLTLGLIGGVLRYLKWKTINFDLL